MRAAAGRPATLFWHLVDDGGTTLTPDGGAVTVTITTGDQVLAVSAIAIANPGVVTTSLPHGLATGQQVLIAGVLGATEVNGVWTVTVLNSTTFSIPVSVTHAFAGGGLVSVALYANQTATYVLGDLAWEWTLPPQTRLDTLTATWSATVSSVSYVESKSIDIVAARLADPFLMRQADPDIQAIAAAAMGKETLLILIDQIEEGIRDIIGFPPVLEGFRQEWDVLRGTLNDALYVSGTVNGLPYGWGAGKMMIPGIKFPAPAPGAVGPVYSGTINGVPLDPANDIPKLLIQNGAMVWADYRPWISGRYSVWGTHGEVNPDGELRWVARKLCHHFAQSVDFPDRAYSIVTEGAQILFSMPSPDRPTGIPEVDAVLVRKRLSSVI